MKTVRVSPERAIARGVPIFYHKRTLFVKIFTIRDKVNSIYHLMSFDNQNR